MDASRGRICKNSSDAGTWLTYKDLGLARLSLGDSIPLYNLPNVGKISTIPHTNCSKYLYKLASIPAFEGSKGLRQIFLTAQGLYELTFFRELGQTSAGSAT